MDNPQKNETWTEAFVNSPGPRNFREYRSLFIKGLCMGAADIVPGVSGGTIALISGIYQNLLEALQSISTKTVKYLFKFEIKSAISTIHLRFLLTLFSGILIAIVSIARVMNYLLIEYPTLTWSLFFGLIAASILILGKGIEHWSGKEGVTFLMGTLGAYFLVGLIPVTTPETWWFIIFSGMIAICAMILPGISGSFILLLLSKYEFMTSALKHPFDSQNIIIVSLFCLGCVIGLTGFSRILSYFLSRFEQITMALLTGFLLGSLRKIWPWKEVIETRIIRGKTHVTAEINVLPEAMDIELILSISLMIFGFLLILFLEKKALTRD